MKRKPLRRAEARKGFTYRPREKHPPRPRQPQRSFTRKELLRAALEEFHLGHDGLTSLYASLLARRLVAVEPGLEEYGRSLDNVLAAERTGALE